MLHDWKKSKHKWPQWALLEPYHWQSLPSFSTIIFLIKSDAVFFFAKCQGQQATQTSLNQCDRRSQQQRNGKKPKSPAELLHGRFLSSGGLKGTFHVELKVVLNWSHTFLRLEMWTFTLLPLQLNWADSFTSRVRVKGSPLTSESRASGIITRHCPQI